MPFCPRCGTEYRPGVRECSDCRVPLLNEPPPPAPSEETIEEALSVAYEAADEVAATTARDLLTQAGIPFVEQQTSVFVLDHIDSTMRNFFSRFLVPQSRAREATELIQGYLAAPDLPESEN